MTRALGAVLLIVSLVSAPAAGVAAAPPAGLSVSIESDRSEVTAGDSVTYTATVQNAGVDAVAGRLVITVPEYVRITDWGGAAEGGADASWDVTVDAGETVTKTISVQLDTIPDEELRVTTLVGLYIGDDPQPVIRSADAAAIAGVEDPAHAAQDDADSSGPGEFPFVWLLVGAVVLASAIGAWLLLRRRGTPTP